MNLAKFRKKIFGKRNTYLLVPAFIIFVFALFVGLMPHHKQTASVTTTTQKPITTTTTPLPPLARPATFAPRDLNVPILMYHHINDHLDPLDRWASGLTVSSKSFEAQVKYLQSSGYTIISMRDLFNALYLGKALPAKSVIFTFDDGYDDNYSQAFPILKKYKATGTFFIITGFIDRPKHMTTKQMKEMSDAGMEVEPHSVHHVELAQINPKQAAFETDESKKVVERITGKSCYFFAYPSGSFNAAVEDNLQKQGYMLAVTTEYSDLQQNSKPFELKRIRAMEHTDLGQLLK